jgi:hypothetical protein
VRRLTFKYEVDETPTCFASWRRYKLDARLRGIQIIENTAAQERLALVTELEMQWKLGLEKTH